MDKGAVAGDLKESLHKGRGKRDVKEVLLFFGCPGCWHVE